MGNDVVCKTIGIGNICMKMFDGQVRTLMNVRYILNLKKNLLLLGTLETHGYKFSGADGAIKVTKGSMMILKGERTANFYKMIGSVIVFYASTTTEKEDTIILWHIRLGHMSERDLQVKQQRCSIIYQILQTRFFFNFASWVNNVE